MGNRLFWKFFLIIWLALLTMGGGMGAAFWLQRNTAFNSEQEHKGNTSRTFNKSFREMIRTSILDNCPQIHRHPGYRFPLVLLLA